MPIALEASIRAIYVIVDVKAEVENYIFPKSLLDATI